MSHLFLDLDGTVTDSREGIVRCLSHALMALEKPIPADSALEGCIGSPLARVFETLLDTTDEGVVRSAIDVYRERFSSIGILENRVYPEIPAALSALVDRGFTLCLVTSKPSVFARRILDHFGLSQYFTQIYGPELDDTMHSKATLIRRALESERVVPGAALMIGDRREDVEGARSNGMRSIGVTWGYGSRAELEGAGADHVVSTVPELLTWLGCLTPMGSVSRTEATDAVEDVLRFWFPPLEKEDHATMVRQFEWWFRGGATASIAARFSSLMERAARGELDHWSDGPRSRLALIIVLDQFSRSLHAGTPRAFAQDEKAVGLAQQGLEIGHYAALETPWEKTFFLLPFGHSEQLAHLDLAVALAEELVERAPGELRRVLAHSAGQAHGHREIIARFGRHPHRNAVLGRQSTPEELDYLARGELVHTRRPPE